MTGLGNAPNKPVQRMAIPIPAMTYFLEKSKKNKRMDRRVLSHPNHRTDKRETTHKVGVGPRVPDATTVFKERTSTESTCLLLDPYRGSIIHAGTRIRYENAVRAQRTHTSHCHWNESRCSQSHLKPKRPGFDLTPRVRLLHITSHIAHRTWQERGLEK